MPAMATPIFPNIGDTARPSRAMFFIMPTIFRSETVDFVPIESICLATFSSMIVCAMAAFCSRSATEAVNSYLISLWLAIFHALRQVELVFFRPPVEVFLRPNGNPLADILAEGRRELIDDRLRLHRPLELAERGNLIPDAVGLA